MSATHTSLNATAIGTCHNVVTQAGNYRKHEASGFSRMYKAATPACVVESALPISRKKLSAGDAATAINGRWSSPLGFEHSLRTPEPAACGAGDVQLILKRVGLHVSRPGLLGFPASGTTYNNVATFAQYAPLMAARALESLVVETSAGCGDVVDLSGTIRANQARIAHAALKSGIKMPKNYKENLAESCADKSYMIWLPTREQVVVCGQDLTVRGSLAPIHTYTYGQDLQIATSYTTVDGTSYKDQDCGSFVTGTTGTAARDPARAAPLKQVRDAVPTALADGDVEVHLVAEYIVVPRYAAGSLVPESGITQALQYETHAFDQTVYNTKQNKHVTLDFRGRLPPGFMVSDIHVGAVHGNTQSPNAWLCYGMTGFGVARHATVTSLHGLNKTMGNTNATRGPFNSFNYEYNSNPLTLDDGLFAAEVDAANQYMVSDSLYSGVGSRFPVIESLSLGRGGHRTDSGIVHSGDAIRSLPGMRSIHVAPDVASGLDFEQSDLGLYITLDDRVQADSYVVDVNGASATTYTASAIGATHPRSKSDVPIHIVVLVEGYYRTIQELKPLVLPARRAKCIALDKEVHSGHESFLREIGAAPSVESAADRERRLEEKEHAERVQKMVSNVRSSSAMIN